MPELPGRITVQCRPARPVTRARAVTDSPRGKVSVAESQTQERSRFERRLGCKRAQGTYKFIINQIPPHHTYIEPFLGWGAIMLHKAPANHSILIDKEAEKVSSFLLELTSAHPTIAAALVKPDDVLWSTIGGTTESGHQRQERRGDRASLIVGDAISFLASYQWRGDEFVYLDPPYIPETRSSRHRYLFEMSTLDHQALLDVLSQVPAKVMLSGYHSKLYEKILRKWRVVTFEAITRGGTMRTEHLWCNFPEPVELHDYRYLGKNFRERQDINRMRKRWIAKLRKMPILKQRALFAAIKEFNDGQ